MHVAPLAAYLDPSQGSVIVQLAAGGVASVVVILRSVGRRSVRALLRRDKHDD